MSKEIQSIQVSLTKLLSDTNLSIKAIVIPIIQRDYAQGRDEEFEIRTNFLQNLRLYIEDEQKESHDLDFVYGNLNSDKEFIPLDGQQRLTTLFLLHYYLSIHDNKFDDFKSVFATKDNHSRFLYQTRLSSTDFCNALINNPINLPTDSTEKISQNILNRYPWFSDSWKYDPTVVSMLNMLDSIHTCFGDTNGLYERLADTQFPAITFQVLYMSESGLTDDLYIKMNSRGLELTPFENLKAHIIKRLKDNSETRELVRTANKGGEIVSVKDYFAFKMDINWANLFWIYRKIFTRKTDRGESYEVCDVDTSLLNIINTIVLNYKALKPELGITNEDLTRYNELYWSYYSNVPDDFYLELIDVLDVFEKDACLEESEQAGICDRLAGRSKFDVRKTFEKFVKKEFKDAAYDEHIRLYAYYAYLRKHKENFNQDDFAQWMRIVMNLTMNHTWQNVEDFCRSMRTIRWLNEHNENGILELMCDERNVQNSGFNPVQFHEECIKACLLLRKDAIEWEKAIYDAENIKYLTGQIISILNFSEIEAYYNKHHACDWSADSNSEYINRVNNYIHLYSFVFFETGVKKELIEDKQLFRRALLCKGDYLIGISSNRWSLIIDKHRDYSWHRYLQDDNEGRRIYFKQLLDEYNEDSQTFISYLDDVINNYTTDDIHDWRYLLIREPHIWNHFGKDYLLRFHNADKDVYVLSTITMGGWHAELRSLYLYYQALNESFLKKFIKDNYNYSESWEPAYLEMKNDKDFKVGIQFYENQWRIWIEIIKEEYTFSPQQIQFFEKMGFSIDDVNVYAQQKDTLDNKFLIDIANNILS